MDNPFPVGSPAASKPSRKIAQLLPLRGPEREREREREGEKVKGIQFKKKRLHLFSCSFISND